MKTQSTAGALKLEPREKLANHLADFVSNLDTARELYRRYPQLVTVDSLPEPFASSELNWEPENAPDDYGDRQLVDCGILAAPAQPGDQLHDKPVTSEEQNSPPPQAPSPGRPAFGERPLAQLREDVVEAVPGQEKGPNGLDYHRARERFLASVLETQNLDDHEAASLAICQRLIREDRGCSTPFESFFQKLVFIAGYRAVTFEDTMDELEEYKDNWNSAVALFRKFSVEHPDIVTTQKRELG